MNTLLEARGLVKHYSKVEAVNGVSFALPQGHCLGLLGPNGAGKTTTVEMLEGLVTPTAGEVLYRGAPLGPRFRAEAGIMFQNTALQEHLTTREALQLFQSLYDQSAALDVLIDRCTLQSFVDRDVRKLSGGQRQRLLLAIALVNEPDILFLDEPTTGLDPQARRNFWSLVGEIKAQGKTVLLTTHYMEEAYALCDEVAIMDHGRIIARGGPQQLLADHFADVVLQLPQEDVPPAQRAGLSAVVQHGLAEITTGDVNATVRRLLDAGVSLARLRIRERTLEDLFLKLTGEALRA